MSILERAAARARGTYYGWWLVPITGFIHIITSVPLFHSMGMWFVALESAFGWNRTQLSLAFAFTRIEGGILGPIEGALVDRLGTRRMVLIGLTIMGGGFLLMAQVRTLPMFYLAFLVMALGQGLGGWLPLNAMLTNWFSRNRAKAMGWAASTARLGALGLIPVMAWAVDPQADNLGWRLTATIIGVFVILVAFPISRLIRNRPEDYGLRPDGDTLDGSTRTGAGRSRTQSRSEGMAANTPIEFTVMQAVRTRAFWLISIGHGFTSMAIIAIMAHLAPLLTDQGLSLPQAALVVTAYTCSSMVFQIVGGYIGDRVPKNIALFGFTMIQALALLILTISTNTPMAFAFAVLFGMGFGGRSPLTTSIRGDYFGRRSFGRIMGISQVPMNILLLGAPVVPGILRDIQGTYTTAFLILAVLNVIGGLLFLMARKPTLSPPVSRAGLVDETGQTGTHFANALAWLARPTRRFTHRQRLGKG